VLQAEATIAVVCEVLLLIDFQFRQPTTAGHCYVTDKSNLNSSEAHQQCFTSMIKADTGYDTVSRARVSVLCPFAFKRHSAFMRQGNQSSAKHRSISTQNGVRCSLSAR